jgi:hypothetical protein
MHARIPNWPTVICIATLAILSACAAEQASVIEKLDELTAVTITHSRTPIIVSPNTHFDPAIARDYVQIGPIEINRMGSLQYFLWLGISETQHFEIKGEHPDGFESIVLIADDEKFPLNVHGWTHAAIGSSEAIYEKLFQSSVDAYYEVTPEQIRLLADADAIELHTTGPSSTEFVLLYRQTRAKDDLTEFLGTVLQ